VYPYPCTGAGWWGTGVAALATATKAEMITNLFMVFFALGFFTEQNK